MALVTEVVARLLMDAQSFIASAKAAQGTLGDLGNTGAAAAGKIKAAGSLIDSAMRDVAGSSADAAGGLLLTGGAADHMSENVLAASAKLELLKAAQEHAAESGRQLAIDELAAGMATTAAAGAAAVAVGPTAALAAANGAGAKSAVGAAIAYGALAMAIIMLTVPTTAVIGGFIVMLADLVITLVAVAAAGLLVAAAFAGVAAGALYALDQVGVFDAKAGVFQRDLAAVKDALLTTGTSLQHVFGQQGGSSFLDGIAAGLIRVIQTVTPFLDQIVAGFKGLGGGILNSFISLINAVGPYVVRFVAWLGQAFSNAGGAITNIVQSWLPILAGVFKSGGGALARIFDELQIPAKAFAYGLIDLFHMLGSSTSTTFHSIAQTAADFISFFFHLLGAVIAEWQKIGSVMDGVSVAILRAANALIGPLSQAINNLIPVMKVVGQVVIGAANAIGIFARHFPTLTSWIFDAVAALWALNKALALSSGITGISGVVQVLQGIRIWAAGGATGIAALAGGLGLLAIAIAAVGVAFYAERNPIDVSSAAFLNHAALVWDDTTATQANTDAIDGNANSQRHRLGEYVKNLAGLAATTLSMNVTTGAAHALLDSVDPIGPALGAAGAAALNSTPNLAAMAAEYRTATDAARALYDAEVQLAGGFLAIAQDSLNVIGSQQALAKAQKTVNQDVANGSTHTQKYRNDLLALHQAIITDATNQQQLVGAVLAFVKATDGANPSVKNVVQTVRGLAKELGLTKQQTDWLIGSTLKQMGLQDKFPGSAANAKKGLDATKQAAADAEAAYKNANRAAEILQGTISAFHDQSWTYTFYFVQKGQGGGGFNPQGQHGYGAGSTGGVFAGYAGGALFSSPGRHAFVAGEGGYATPVGTGGEIASKAGVLPLTDEIIGRLGAAIGAASGGGEPIHVHIHLTGEEIIRSVRRTRDQRPGVMPL